MARFPVLKLLLFNFCYTRQGRGAGVPARPGNTTFPRPGVATAAVGPVAGVGVGGVGVGVGVGVGAACGRGANWLPPPRAPLYANNSALLTQLAQPSYPPPPPAHATQVHTACSYYLFSPSLQQP